MLRKLSLGQKNGFLIKNKRVSHFNSENNILFCYCMGQELKIESIIVTKIVIRGWHFYRISSWKNIKIGQSLFCEHEKKKLF